MVEFWFVNGGHPDGWVSQVTNVAIRGLSRLDLSFYLPPSEEAVKTVEFFLDGEQVGDGRLARGEPTEIALRLLPFLQPAVLEIRFGTAQHAPADLRALGAVLVAVRLNGGEPVAMADLARAGGGVRRAAPGDPGSDQQARLAVLKAHADVWRHFDPAYYRTHDTAFAGADDETLFHHFLTEGWRAGLDPSPSFSIAAYHATVADLGEAENPLVHYARKGRAATAAPADPGAPSAADGPAPQFSPADLDAVAPYFNAAHYLAQRPDLAERGVDPLVHFMADGWRIGLDPSPDFSTAFYLETNPEIARNGLNPLLHYARHGARELRPAISYVELRRRSYRPLVSVVVPNFNHAAYLPERLASIFAQTHREIELILLDDASTDDSRAVLERLAEASPFPVATAFNETNSGNVFAQWRRGLAMARGELVWICESDDSAAPDALERLVAHMADRGVMLAFGRILFCDEAGVPDTRLDAWREWVEAGIWATPRVAPASVWFAGALGRNNVIANVGGCLIRNQPLDDAVWDAATTLRICGDWYLYSVLARGGMIAYEPAAVTYFRQHSKNTSASNFDKLFYYEEYVVIMRELRRRFAAPAETAARFVASLERQWRHYGMDARHGTLEEAVPGLFEATPVTPETHVLVGSLGFVTGGGEMFPLQIANGLARAGVRTSMVCRNLSDYNPEMLALLDPRVAVYDGARMKAGASPRAALMEIGASVVHSHSITIDDLFFKGEEGPVDVPYIVTLHGSHDVPNLSIDALMFRMLKGVTTWVYTAEKNLALFGRAPLDRRAFVKIPNSMPADPRPFPLTRAQMGVAEDAVLFTFVGRGIQMKGWRAATSALRRLRERHPELKVHLAMVGDGPRAQEVEATTPPDLPVSFLGFQSCINGLYRLSDVALVPTRFTGESFPLCIIQALQEGVPVIATDIGEIRAMLTDDGDGDGARTAGIVVPNLRDSEAFFDTFAAAMADLADPGRRAAARAVVERVASRFDFDRLVVRYAELYAEAVARHAAGNTAVAGRAGGR